MWSIPTRKYSGGIRFKRSAWRLGQRGQTSLEYLILIAVVVSLFVVVARPFLNDLSKKFQSLSKQGIFSDDPSGSAFYYYPLPK